MHQRRYAEQTGRKIITNLRYIVIRFFSIKVDEIPKRMQPTGPPCGSELLDPKEVDWVTGTIRRS